MIEPLDGHHFPILRSIGHDAARNLQGIVDNLCCFSRYFMCFLLHFVHLCV